jgi:endonuclease/exonuclease/phosphatase family metal-dependent hydrolase
MRNGWPALLLPALMLASCAMPAPMADGLRIASWNLEHLAETSESGCRPRTDADYDALKAYTQVLDADVIAFQEVESVGAARRVFDPAIYDIFMEARTGTADSRPPCYGKPEQHLNRQATGFAVKRGLAVSRRPDVTSLQDGDPNLRSGVDIIVTPAGGAPIRLLSVHLKSGCAGGTTAAACEVLSRQARQLADWIRARAEEPLRFVVLGDFNRRLALPGDPVWATLDQPPGPADMTLAAGETPPACDPRYTSFIDHIVVDSRTLASGMTFSELTYAGDRLSDHCAVSVRLSR